MFSARGIADNLASNAIWAILALIVGGLALLLASLNPFFRLFAPLSYLLAVLLALLLAALIAMCGAWAYRRIWPIPPPTPAPQALPAPEQATIDLAPIEEALAALEERHETLVVEAATHAGEIVGLEANLAKLQKPSPGDYLAYERWIQMQEDEVHKLVAKAKKACEKIMAQGGLSKTAPSAAQFNSNMLLEGDAYFSGDAINKIMEQVCGKTFDFSAKTILAENPNRYAEGEEDVEGPEEQYEYRKAYWTSRQFDTAMNAVEPEFSHARATVYNAVIKAGPEFKDKFK